MQLPLAEAWNGRFLNVGDGGKDGDLDFADHRVAQGYAIANSNTGHDAGSEPGASFAYDNRQAEIDFGYRAVHVTVTAANTLLQEYYGRPAEYSYHEGCSTGGRQGLMEAQRFPGDFDGIVAGAPVAFYQELNALKVWYSQRLFADEFAGNLAFDRDGDGVQESLTKLNLLADAVMMKCDTLDGIMDGVIDDPQRCEFDPAMDLMSLRCSGDRNSDNCLTERQLDNIAAIYEGPVSRDGTRIFKGMSPGSELAWRFIPHASNGMQPFSSAADHVNYLFYERDPGVVPQDLTNVDVELHKGGPVSEWAWWQFDIEDLADDSADFMRTITNATDPDLRRFLLNEGGRLLVYQGWADGSVAPEPILDYYRDVVETTFGGDIGRARARARLFLLPGMYHCRGGPGPNEFDALEAIVNWVERGTPPDYMVARREDHGRVVNERKVCAWPLKAIFTGPEGSENDPERWVAENFTCQ